MDPITQLKLNILNACKEAGFDVTLDDIEVTKCKDSSQGDYSTNIALKLAHKK